ncbi:FAD-dependent oxidoreductase [Sedimenticola thiotaurini]|uniref:FAD-dependent oxidoreductase n=1 Tax=Sedimenticola thiotaurini TaxID=1543721 RepID=A0A0F7JXD7_9GAMM|nr:FAD-dependent oxidoreductase [Sedimenticola thiotaurini]AKH19465.1 FAD-dependent oxidoreductase [Sedimenticola thiotaurini]
MLQTHQNPVYPFVHSTDQDAATPVHHPIIVVGAGPVGMAAGLDAAAQGIQTVILDDNNTVSIGSRAVCYAKRALEILDRLGCGQPMVDKGITWNLGKVFFRDDQVYSFNLLPESDHHRPAFINLQQYYLEEFMVDRIEQLEQVDLRWKSRVIAVKQSDDRVEIRIETPEGEYTLTCDYLIVADGANSGIRKMMGLESSGKVFQDRFLIADVVMETDFPPERWFWFDPPFHKGGSTLLHRQADNVWRIDFQLGWDADPEEEKKPEKVIPRLKAMLGEEARFELEWTSVYTFQCRRMEKFRHGRVFFAGDAAHQVSPFGARGANSGFQDTDNLLWKMKLVLDGKAPARLLDTYDEERIPAADENLRNSTRSTDFITPKSEVSRIFRDATLLLAEQYPFARTMVNSGRLSIPAVYRDSTLNTPDEANFDSNMAPGTPSTDAPVNTGDWFLQLIANNRFNGLYFSQMEGSLNAEEQAILSALTENSDIPCSILVAGLDPDGSRPTAVMPVKDTKGILKQRFDGRPGTFYLFRPDQHVAGRWRNLDKDKIDAALNRAISRT